MSNIILKTWFPKKGKYQKWWFQGKFNEESRNKIKECILKVDNELENNHLNYFKKNPRNSLAGILYYDQLIRHIQKNNNKTEKVAIELCLYAIQKQWIPNEPHYAVFFLLPLRHTNNNMYIDFTIKIVEHLNKYEESGHYKRFLKHSHTNHIVNKEYTCKNDLNWLRWLIEYRDILCNKTEYKYNNTKEWIFKTDIWKCFKDFIEKNKNTIIISLSGGVDSMVFLYLCILYKEVINNNFNFKAVHINWNQRIESSRESEFLIKYLERAHVEYIYENINTINRKQDREYFEKKGKEIRFNLYKKALKRWNDGLIFLGHHKGDIIENVFTNIIQRKHYFNLGKMEEIQKIDDIIFIRPFLSIDKEDIYEVAKREFIPFFKNTTPDWSNRGTMREMIFPKIKNQFGKSFEVGFLSMANTSREIGELINNLILNPYMKTVTKIEENQYKFKIDKDYPCIFFKLFFEKLLYSLDKNKIKDKAIESWFYYKESKPNWNRYILGKNYIIENIVNEKAAKLIIN